MFDDNYNVFLQCDLNQDMDDAIMKKLVGEFGCKKDIYKFSVNLNGNYWTASLDEETTGAFNMKYFHVTNFSLFNGNIKSNSFREVAKVSI